MSALRRIVALVAAAGGAYLLLILAMSTFQERLLFYPEHLPDDYVFSSLRPHEEVFLHPEKGVRLHGLYFPADEPRGAVLYFHGNAGSLRSWGEVAENFLELDHSVLVTDYRTYGKSRGPLSEQALLDDALAWYDALAERHADTDITVYGRSLGTAPAAYAASQRKPVRLFLETPFYSMVDLAKRWFPWVPGALVAYPLRTHVYLEQVSAQVIIVHGTDDEIVPYECGARLAELLEPGDRFETIEGGSHNNLVAFAGYRDLLRETFGVGAGSSSSPPPDSGE